MKMKTAPAWLAAVLSISSMPALALDITLPAETATYRPSKLPGYQLVLQNCMACHSAQYVQTQPLTSSRAYWEAAVKKMKKPYGAPLRDEDMPPMVDYLVKTYGAERGSETPATAAKVKARPTEDSAPRTVEALLGEYQCRTCHAVDKKVLGPAFHDVATKYARRPDAMAKVMQSIRAGGQGKWGQVPMPPYPQISNADLKTLAKWVLNR